MGVLSGMLSGMPGSARWKGRAAGAAGGAQGEILPDTGNQVSRGILGCPGVSSWVPGAVSSSVSPPRLVVPVPIPNLLSGIPFPSAGLGVGGRVNPSPFWGGHGWSRVGAGASRAPRWSKAAEEGGKGDQDPPPQQDPSSTALSIPPASGLTNSIHCSQPEGA